MSTPDPTPTPTAPDWRALCADLFQAIDRYFVDANGGARLDAAVDRVRAALATPPAPPPEPRGCPTPGACSCPTAPIVPPELIRALEMAEAALSDIGDADREPGDDIAWAERRAAQDLPRIRHALQMWRDHATPPAATREAGPLPQTGAVSERLLGVAVDGVPCDFIRTLLRPAYEPGDGSADGAQLVSQAWWHPIMGCDSLQIVVDNARAALARWGGAAVPVAAADGRDPVCVAQWPDCRDGAYDPRCCRFPKSCSCGPLQQPAAAGEGRDDG
jgi:hypothetical protein